MTDWDDLCRDKAGIQEAELSDVLHRLDFTSVLDVGCGMGRLAGMLLGNWPQIDYFGIDPSRPRLAIASRRFPGARFEASSVFSLRSSADLVLCVQVLMHLPPEKIERAVARLKASTRRHLVTLDRADSGAAHDYRKLLGVEPAAVFGQQAIFHWRPGP